MADLVYAPVDTPKPVADGIFIVDSGPMSLGPVRFPVRMTVIRLPDGTLLLHSPTRFSFALKEQLDGIGRIAHLVAPNIAHWTFIEGWESHLPEAVCWAARGLRERPAVKKSKLRIDHVLSDAAPPEWGDAIETVEIAGAGLVEVALFHRPSRTLVLTDLVVNLEPHKLSLVESLGARLVGATAPHGRAPVYARAAIKAKGARTGVAARRLLALAPERVIFAHGKWFESDATAQLARSLDWLVKD